MALTSEWSFDLCSPFWRLYRNRGAGAWLLCNGRTIPLQSGEFWLIPAWVRFRTAMKGRTVQDYLHFEARGISAVEWKRSFPEPLQVREDQSLTALHQLWQSSAEPEASLRAQALAYTAFATAFSQLGPRAPQPGALRLDEKLREAIERLEAPEGPLPSNGELAKRMGCCEDHFIRLFRQQTGVSPARYGQAQRMAAAAEALIGSDRTIDDLADALGFSDRSHFSRRFKAEFGQSPAAYRRNHRQEVSV